MRCPAARWPLPRQHQGQAPDLPVLMPADDNGKTPRLFGLAPCTTSKPSG